VWLPLPHLLNALPVQVDLFYRTGASGVAISMVSFAVTIAAIAWIVERLTASWSAALAATLVFAANPSVVYLQSTPMTEPLLLALTGTAVALLIAWTLRPPSSENGREIFSSREEPARDDRDHDRSGGVRTWHVGTAFALACLTRYEAWPVAAGALVCAAWARWRRGDTVPAAVRRVAAIAAYPAAAIVAFMIFSRIVVGEWFVASGFFVPENVALDHPVEAAKQIVWGVQALSGPALVVIAALGLGGMLLWAIVDGRRATAAIPAALFGTAALPWAAFYRGHPYRIRYMVPLIAAEAIAAGFAAGMLSRFSRRARHLGALALAVVALIELRPFDPAAPMVVEAQWDRPNIAARQPIADFLRQRYDGTTIMASMGSVGHYMQQLSQSGFALRDFLHEGNGDIWLNALEHPRPYAGWILIEEKAEGGDMLAARAREDAEFLEGYSRVAEGAGLALYRREDAPERVTRR
jgi:hypothetical protein